MKNAFFEIGIRLILSLFFVFWIHSVYAQHIPAKSVDEQFFEEQCAATYIEQKQVEQLGIYGTRDYFEVWVQDKKKEIRRNPYNFRTQADAKRLIPVVVHVIHNGTPIGQGANIPLSQIEAQIAILNEDYSRQNPDAGNTPAEFQGLAASANIEFVLAKRDPTGLPTTGVNRVAGSKSFYTPDDDALIGQLAQWPPEDYMNIWVVPLQSPYLGYSSFPISELPGLNFPPNTRETDGVTIDYRVFGEGGNAQPNSAGRTATHEIGHFFGLRHIWGDASGCDVDDYVEDTPLQNQATNTCVAGPQFSCDSRDMIENFMDYTPDQCMSLFTIGQVERMDVVLNFSPRRQSLVNGIATREPDLAPNDLALQEIIAPDDFSCGTSVSPQIAVLNVGNNTVTSATIDVTLNGRVVESRNFVLNLASGATEILTFGQITLSSSGENEFMAEIRTVNGVSDSDEANNTLVTHPKVPSSISLPYSVGAGDFSNLWSLKNPDNDSTWDEIALQIDGQAANLIYFNGFNYSTVGELDYWISPQINLTTATNAQLKFEMSYAPYSDEEYQETLLVAVSTDCGNTFDLLQAPYNKKGSSLMTEEATSEQFFPSSASQFRTELVNLSQYAGEGDIRIAFVSVNGYGNNIFIKDIEILPSEEYRYRLQINNVLNPGPITDGSQEEEILQITNSGNLPISDFVIQRRSDGARLESHVVENQFIAPGETQTYSLSSQLRAGENRVEYEILRPNHDQNPGSSSKLIRYFIQSDSAVVVPWRQGFDGPSGIQPWATVNPEKNAGSWQQKMLQEDVDNQVLALENMERGNSYWLGSPLFDLSTTNEASIFFHWAATGFNTSDITEFSVLISDNGGNSYEELWRKENVQLNTSGSGSAATISRQDFVREYLDLSQFTGERFEKIRLAFKVVYRNGSSHPIYLDDIELFLSANPAPVDPGLGNALVFPNPAFDYFNVTFNLEEYEAVNIQIISPSGQIVYDADYPNTLNQTYTFNTSLFNRGVFILRITGEKLSETKRLIIQ